MSQSRKCLVSAVTAIALFAATSSPQAKQPVRIDASTDRKVEQSYSRMLRSLDANGKMRLQTAILQLNLIGVSSVHELLTDPELQKPTAVRIKDRIAGLHADEIMALAARTATTRIVIPGQEPGLPADLLRPLAPGETTHALSSTRWKLTSNTNGHVLESLVELDAAGSVRNSSASTTSTVASSWEQSADEVRLLLNDRYAVYLGKLIDTDRMQGIGGNKMGTTWTWTAERL